MARLIFTIGHKLERLRDQKLHYGNFLLFFFYLFFFFSVNTIHNVHVQVNLIITLSLGSIEIDRVISETVL